MPLREDRGDLIVKLFGDEVIEAGLDLKQRGVERGLGAVARMEMEFRVYERRFLSAKPPKEWKSQAT